jgi:hypothetical protein
MNKIFKKPTHLYQPKYERDIKLNGNSTEPSEQTTLGKIHQKPQNKIKNEKPIKIFQNNENKIAQKEISQFPVVINKEEEKIENKAKKIKENEKYYLSREIALTVDTYGNDIFSYLKDNEPRFLIPLDFMNRHNLSPFIRERMVDWMVEVFSVYQCDPGTLELAVHIMDCYISRTPKKLKDEDIHLIGLTCIYISSKVEDIIPLRMPHIVKSIGHNNFKEGTIMKKEREIIKTIDFDLFTAGALDYITTFFYDLKVNNVKKIKELNAVEIIEKYLNFSIFLSQLLLYSSEFVCYRQCLNALAVLILAFDILKTNLPDLSNDLKNYLSDWVYYIINEMRLNSDAISVVYTKIYDFYYKMVIMPQKMNEKNNKGKNNESQMEIINLCKFNQDKFI